ncbi:hypothetical protein [Herbaspirillum rubrisubalbicans]|nr:hypothetical protein [Herbaspirillum rubrisubalbicans]
MKVAILIVGIAVILLWRHLSKKGQGSAGPDQMPNSDPEADVVIFFDDEQVRVTYPNGEVRSLHWAELSLVGIQTTDDGPLMSDVFWGLHGADGTPAIIYPQGASGEPALLAAMQKRLAGFDNEKVIQAMGCTNDAYFKVWMSK